MVAGVPMMPNRKSLLALGVVASLLSVLRPPSLALAQDEPSESTASSDRELDRDPEGRASDDGESAGGRSSDIQEVIHVEGVRASGLKEVPISVTQFGASDIQNLRIQNVADLSAYTPNLEINTAFAASNPTLFIRGVGLKDYNSNSTGAVSIWQDGIMMNSPAAQLFSLYDIQSIEILKGPIGGIGGRNASAGQIRIHSFKPTEEWTSDGSFSYGNLNLLEFEGALGFPIFPELFNNTLSFRVAVTTGFRDGYTNNTCADWDPEKFDYLEPSEERTLEFYQLLDPFDRELPLKPNGRIDPNSFIYRNIDAVDLYNSFPNKNRINTITVDGELVGRQTDFFIILGDGVCLLDNPGRVVTHRREARGGAPGPEGTFIPQQNVRLLSDFQGLQDTYNDVEYYASRFQLLWEPSERLSFLGNFHWGANRGDSYHLQAVGARARPTPEGVVITDPPGFVEAANSDAFTEIGTPLAPFEDLKGRGGLSGDQQGLTPGFAGDDVFNGFYSTDGKENLDLWGVVLHTTYEPDWGRIEYVGGYEFNSRDILDEGGDCPCTDLEAEIDDETWQFSNDLQVVVDGNRFEWTFGFFQLHEELNSFNHYPSSIKFEIDQTYQQITDAWNVGTNFHYDFLEDAAYRWLYQISFDGAFRYDWEQKKFTLGALSRKVFADVEKDTIEEQTVKGSWDGPAGEATLSILPVENARLYFKVTHGRKAGHFNAGLTIKDEELFTSFDEVGQESVWAAEVGLKSSWFDDRLELSGAFFRYWYKDMQVFDIVNDFGNLPTQHLLNADANVLGAEAGLTIRPVDGLLLQVSMGWLDATYGEFIVVKQGVPPSGTGPSQGSLSTFNYEDNPLIAAPEWSLSGYAEYELPLYRWGSLVPSFNFSYKSRTYFDPTNEELISQKPFWLFGARLSYRTPGGTIEVAGWVKNFLDRQYKIDAFDLTRQFRQINEVWAEPRTYGLTVSYSF